MSFTFPRPIGAAADAMELEYIAALHQTDDEDDEGWLDASIEASDVKYFLMSRYGISITKEECRKLIFSGLAGGDGEDDCIDIVEIVAILIIPYLSKLVQNEKDEKSLKHDLMNNWELKALKVGEEARATMMADADDIISKVLKIILLDSIGSEHPPPLTKDLLRTIFARYEEIELIQDDDLLDEMIEVASGGRENALLDHEAFARALTDDIKKYDARKESRVSTHYEDVFGIESNLNDEASDSNTVRRVFTFPQIDFLADTFRSRLHFACSLIAFIFTYINYFDPTKNDYLHVCSEERRDLYRCQISQSIVIWLLMMVIVAGIGTPFVSILNLGNNPHRTSLLEIVGGMIGVGLLIIFPACYEFDAKFFRTKPTEAEREFVKPIFVTLIIIGSVLLLLQILGLIRILLPNRLLGSMKWLELLRGSAAKNETGIKQAAAFKVHQMVKNAYMLHQEVEGSRTSRIKETMEHHDKSTNAVALLNYTKVSEKTENIGGFRWCWNQFFTGQLVYNEGIWIHTRMLAANFAQIAVTFFVAFGGILILSEVINFSPEVDFESSAEENYNGCQAQLLEYTCSFPEFNNRSQGFGVCNVIYPDECNFSTVEGELQKQYCGYFFSSNDVMQQFGISTCPDVIYPDPDSIYAATTDSDYTSYCAAALTACSKTPVSTPDGDVGLCIVGIDGIKPYQFTGDKCSNHTAIAKVIEDGNKQREDTEKEVEEVIDNYTPKKWVFVFSGAWALGFTILAGAYNAMINVPSIIIATLKLRCGVIPSLRDPNFKKLRANMLLTTSLIGASVWGSIFMSIGIAGLMFIPPFLLTYEVTRMYMLSFLSLLLGVIITLLVKVLLTTFLAKKYFSAFYRKRPVICNLINIAFECWHLALTAGFILARAVKIILIAILFLGRFDRPFLSEGVGTIGPINLDNFPYIFRKDLLSVDAHRHPYIERLGLMYMMKLKFGDKFGRQSSSIWRLLFVFALMPWLRKYRIFTEEDAWDDNVKKVLQRSVDNVKKSDRKKDPVQRIKDLEEEIEKLRTQLA